VSTVNIGIAVVEPYDPAVTPLLLSVVEKVPEPVPVTSPDKVVVALPAITSVPIVKPKLVLASEAVVAPVPPFAIAIVVPLQVPLVIVPTVFKFDKEVNVVFEVAVIFPAVIAVVALPDKSPIKFGAVTVELNVFAPAIV
jgi:hypothetical protein